VRLSIYKLILYFLGLLEKRSHSGYAGSPGFWVDLVGRLGLTGLIASLNFCDLKPSQGLGQPTGPGRVSNHKNPHIETMCQSLLNLLHALKKCKI
jgi:hypothetical protein